MSNRFLVLTLSMAAALVALSSEARSATVVGPPAVAWKSMTFAQKKAYMKAAVTPKMKTVFQEFDAKKFKTFTCLTCHGEDGPDRKFKMPSNGIKPLPNTPEAFQAKLKTEPDWPKWAKFMSEKVEPAMGTLLDLPVFDPKKPVEGAFSCAACHKLEASK
jgi:mono/diheme cytochrome c family protein